MEIAVKSTQRISQLVLLGPVGAKFGPRESSDVVDIFAVPQPRLHELSFYDQAHAQRDYAALSDEELAINTATGASPVTKPQLWGGRVEYSGGGLQLSAAYEQHDDYLWGTALSATGTGISNLGNFFIFIGTIRHKTETISTDNSSCM